MIHLNLLLDEDKKQIRHLRLFNFLENLLALILLFICLITSITLATSYILNNVFYPSATSLVRTISIGNQSFDQQIKQVNQKISAIQDVQKNNLNWLLTITSFIELVPDNVHITNLFIDQNNQRVNIYGTAKTRNELLAFKNNLTNSNVVIDLQSPLSNLLKQTDINFQFIAKLNLDKINQLN
ncbi:MAG: PilN domain-containing protein [Candidatus Aenigmarchaeota archaeon]|nr:PilN domain-containing protein [Candidatus Aenigmarchaeota archaeon]